MNRKERRAGRSRRERKHRQRRQAEARAGREALRLEFERIQAEGGVTLGMTPGQAMDLARLGLEAMARRMTQEGHAEQAPWNPEQVIYNPASLQATVEQSYLLLRHFIDQTAPGTPDPATEEDAFKLMAFGVSGAMSLASAALLFLCSNPIPFELARFVVARDSEDLGFG